ncbi:hypothetical protein LG045_02665 [Limosilactobacillus gastricus]|nr:hypothetical protein LG045_02665 [Limosilactobacillus gastricus]
MRFCTINERYMEYLRSIDSRISKYNYGSDHYKPFSILFLRLII